MIQKGQIQEKKVGKTFIKGRITYHRMDIYSNYIINKTRTDQQLKAYKDKGGVGHHRLAMFGEILPVFDTSLLTSKEIKTIQKGGASSEGRSKCKSYNKRYKWRGRLEGKTNE